MSLQDADPTTMEPLDFARLVKQAPAAQLHDLMTGPRRTAVLDELVRRMPEAFRADRAGPLEAVIHWVVTDRPDGGADRYELVITAGRCRVSPEPAGEPRLTLTTGGVDFLQLITGNAHPVVLVMKGRLRTRGDVALTAKFPKLFDPPKA